MKVLDYFWNLISERRKSFHSKHSLGSDDDSSYSTLSIPQEYPFYYFYYLKFLLFDTSFSADRSVDQSKNSVDILCLEELKTTEELKAIADYVTDTVENNGFVKAIEKFVIKEGANV